MARKYSNTFAETTLTGSISNSATTITIGATAGLPASFPYTLALDYGTANVEMVTVTALAGSNLTVTRGQDGTSAQSHTAGAVVVHPVSARDLSEPQVHMDASADIHGLTGGATVVGTTSTQTLTNKTISGAANTLSNIPSSAITALAANKVSQPFDTLTAVGVNGGAQVVTVTGDEVSRTVPVASWKRGGVGLLVDEDAVVDVNSDLNVGTARAHLAAALTSRVLVTATTKIGMIVARVAANVQDLFQINTEGGSNLFKVASTGAVTTASTITAGAGVSGTTLASSAGTTVGTTLGVTGATTLSSTLGVSGLLTASAGAAVTGAITGSTTITGVTVNGSTDTQAAGVSLPRGRIASATHSTGYDTTGVGATEVIGISVTFTAVAGRRYKLTYSGNYVGSVAGDAMQTRVRWQTGGSHTIAGTSNRVHSWAIQIANYTQPYNLVDELTGLTPGTVTVGLTVKRFSGSGVVNLYADANSTGLLIIEDIGV